jgi:hypothetical protein
MKNVRFASIRKKVELVDWRKWLKETRFGVGLVSSSNFLNKDRDYNDVVLNFEK